MNNICPICGYISQKTFFIENSPEPNWGSNFCDCCFFEFGVDELNDKKGFQSYVEYRLNWALNLKCSNNSNIEWDLQKCLEQLENLKLVEMENFPQWTQDINTDWSCTIDSMILLYITNAFKTNE